MQHTRTSVRGWLWSLLPLLCAAGGVASALSEFGIEGMGVVSTRANEMRGSVSPDGRRIVWGSTDREGGAGGRDLWLAVLKDGRWQDAQPLPFNSKLDDFDPMFSSDGRWLYFSSSRKGGQGGDDLYRVSVQDDGFGKPENLGAGVNSQGDEWAPTPALDGKSLLFASNGHGGAGRHDLLVARWNGKAFDAPKPVPGINTAADEIDAAWLGNGEAIVFARSDDAKAKPIQLQLAQCDGQAYAGVAPLKLSFNSADGVTRGPVTDWNKPGELLVTGSARSPKAGQLDLYRMKAPTVSGKPGCM